MALLASEVVLLLPLLVVVLSLVSVEAVLLGEEVQLKGTPKVANAAACSVIGSTVRRNSNTLLQHRKAVYVAHSEGRYPCNMSRVH